jgi:hypothetical protein
VPAQLYFLCETIDQHAAQAAFAPTLLDALTRLGLGEFGSATWQTEILIPGERVNFLLPPWQRLDPGEYLRIDLDMVAIQNLVPGGAGTGTVAWGINMQVASTSVGTAGRTGQDEVLAAILSGWWRTSPAVQRPVNTAMLDLYPYAESPMVHDQVAGGTPRMALIDDVGGRWLINDAGDRLTITPPIVNVSVRLLASAPKYPQKVFA